MKEGSALRGVIARRAAALGVLLQESQLEQLEGYWTLLARWNAKINLTALPLRGHPAATVNRLIVEPLVASTLMPDCELSWLDVGSGGGSPAIPLKVVRPNAHLTMIESRSRKAAFLREVVRVLGFTDTVVVAARFEQLVEAIVSELTAPPASPMGPIPGLHRETIDYVTIRGVALTGALLSAVRSLLKPTGRLLLFLPAHDPSPLLAGFRPLEKKGDGSHFSVFHVERANQDEEGLPSPC